MIGEGEVTGVRVGDGLVIADGEGDDVWFVSLERSF